MGNLQHDTLWSVFHKITHSAPCCQFYPQRGGKPLGSRPICGALAKDRGELLNHTVGIDLSFVGLGDGDHSSELSLPIEGILILELEGCVIDLRGHGNYHSIKPFNCQRRRNKTGIMCFVDNDSKDPLMYQKIP